MNTDTGNSSLQGKDNAVQPAGWRRIPLWPFVPLGFFAMSLTIATITVVAAVTSDAPVEPAYYEKSLTWDADRERYRSPEALGWDVSVELHGSAGIVTVAVSTVATASHGGTPVQADAVGLEFFHRAASADRQKVGLRRVGDGMWLGHVTVAVTGLHEARIEIVAGEQASRLTRQLEAQEITVAPTPVDNDGNGDVE